MGEEDSASFEALYTATFAHLLGYALRRCGDVEDAADVVAETFAIAWRRIDTVPPGDGARLWLYGVARNVLANHRRGLTRRRELSAALAAEVAEVYERSAEESAGESAEFAAIGRAFRGLPEDDRELLALVAWEGLDHGQIAKVLGCSRNAVRIRLYRARRRLARTLAAVGVSADRFAISGSVR